MYLLSEATNEFLHHCKFEKNLSIRTITFYRIDLLQLQKFFSERNYSLLVTDITKSELREYLEAISSLKPKSIKRKIATIKAMFNYLEYEDKIIANPLRKMRIKIKEPFQLPRVLNIYEVGAIFKSAYSESFEGSISDYGSFEALRNIVVVELLFATGARVSEIASIKENDIDLRSGSITIKGKGNKERMIQICNKDTLQLLVKYQRKFSAKMMQADGFFLINRFNKKLSDQSIRG